MLFAGSKTSVYTNPKAKGQCRTLPYNLTLDIQSCLWSIFKGKELGINLPGGGWTRTGSTKLLGCTSPRGQP